MLSCVLVRHFGAAVEYRHNPALASTDLILATPARVQRVVAASSAPRAQGVQPKLTVKQARLLCPTAEVIPAREEVYQRVAAEIALELYHFANKVEIEYQPTTTAFYLNTDSETALIQGHIAAYLQTPTTVAVAANKFTARVAAAYLREDSPTLKVLEGHEARFLAPYPVTLLPLSADMARRLPLLGLHTLGQLAALPKVAVWEQFGKHGKWLHDLANGIDLRSIQPYQSPQQLRATHSFDDPINDREIIRAVLRRMVKPLVDQLGSQEVHRLTLLLYLDNHALVEGHLQPARPCQDVFTLTRLLDDLLQQQVVTAAVVRVEVHLSDIRRPLPQQLSLFDYMEGHNRLETVLPDWVMRHPATGFYYSELASQSLYALPEDRFTLVEVRGA